MSTFVAGTRRAAWLRVPAAWNSVAVRCLEHSDRECARQTAARHTSTEFVSFLDQIVAGCPEKEIHIILDNLSAHKTAHVQPFLERHPHVKLHFTPTYSSWLNQVEIWFSKLQRDVIIRGVFTSVRDLERKILRYIRLYAKTAKPFKWKYNNVKKRITKR